MRYIPRKPSRTITPEKKKKAIRALLKADGDPRGVKKIADVTPGFINHLLRLSEKEDNDIGKFSKGLGILSHRVSALAFQKIMESLQNPHGVFKLNELAVVAGIGAQRGQELLAKQAPIKEPNWAAIQINIARDGVQTSPRLELPTSEKAHSKRIPSNP